MNKYSVAKYDVRKSEDICREEGDTLKFTPKKNI
jgi:hypothetical protein